MKYFEIYNDNNHLQVDDTYMNLYMTRKIKLNDTFGTIQFQNNEIMAAIGNGTNSINGYCSNSSDHCDYYIDNAQNTYIYIFATEPQVSSVSGMQIFNEAGHLIFDSNQKQAKVIAVGTDSGTVVGSDIAIASGGLTVTSELTVNARDFIETETKYENVTRDEWVTEPYEYDDTEYNIATGKYEEIKRTGIHTILKSVTSPKWVDYYVAVVHGQDVYHTYIHNVYINGGVISTKQFQEKTSIGPWREIYRSPRQEKNAASASGDAFIRGVWAREDKSNSTILAHSFVVLDVSGL